MFIFLVAGGKNYNGSWKYASGTCEIVYISMTLFLSEGQTALLRGFVSDPTPPAVVTGNAMENSAFTYFSGAKVR